MKIYSDKLLPEHHTPAIGLDGVAKQARRADAQ